MQNRFSSVVAIAALTALVSACSDSPTAPPPPATVNTPPTIDSITIATDRVEADRPVQVTAVVRDAESPLGTMTFTWSASPQVGTFTTTLFSGTQAVTTWRPAKGQKTPDVQTVTLTVTESYTSSGQAKQNVVSKSTTAHYNDSQAENVELGFDFLVKKFGNYTVSPEEAVSNFSDSCSGKAEELSDIQNNRENFMILSASFPTPTVSLDVALTEGVVEGPCTFQDIPKNGPNAGKREFVSGICRLTTIYEAANYRWRLCKSNFNPPFSSGLVSLQGRVPGRPYIPQ